MFANFMNNFELCFLSFKKLPSENRNDPSKFILSCCALLYLTINYLCTQSSTKFVFFIDNICEYLAHCAYEMCVCFRNSSTPHHNIVSTKWASSQVDGGAGETWGQWDQGGPRGAIGKVDAPNI